MSDVKKLRPISNSDDRSGLIPKEEATAAIKISTLIYMCFANNNIILPGFLDKFIKYMDGTKTPSPKPNGWKICETRMDDFLIRFKHPWSDTAQEIWKWKEYIVPHLPAKSDDIYNIYASCSENIMHKDNIDENTPRKSGSNLWKFKGFIYEVSGFYTNEEAKLLILEEFDKERRLFEKLRLKFGVISQSDVSSSRPRIPENVRIEVWRRDSGKCARCGSRTNLEYDHIVPISKGGSNTARNIELLCEKCNRSKSNNVM